MIYTKTDILKAMASEPIGLLDAEVTEKELRNALKYSYADIGHKIDKTDADYLVKELMKLIYNRFRHFRPKELEVAFRQGVAGKYGEVKYLSAVAFQQFLTLYERSAERTELIKQVQTDPAKLIEEKKFNIDEYIDWLYTQWKEKGQVFDMTGAGYEHLEKEGKINLTKEQKWDYVSKAEIELTNIKKKQALDIVGQREYSKFIEQIAQKNENVMATIKRKARNLALADYFKSIKDGK